MFPTFKHLSDPALVHELDVAVVHERRNTAKVVALIAEVDACKLYRIYGYPSIFQYCVGRLGLSEDEAYKRMQAAFAAQSFPEILDMLADGHLHLTAIVKLRPHLTPENAGELVVACTHKSKRAIEKLLAERFPQADVPTVILPIALMPAPNQAAATLPLSANPATLDFGHQDREPISNEELVSKPVSPIAMVEIKASMVPLDRALLRPIASSRRRSSRRPIGLASHTVRRIRAAFLPT